MVQLLAGPREKWREAALLCSRIAGTFPVGSFRNEQACYTRAWLLLVHQEWSESQNAFNELIKLYPAKAQHPPIVAYLAQCQTKLAAKGNGEENDGQN